MTRDIVEEDSLTPRRDQRSRLERCARWALPVAILVAACGYRVGLPAEATWVLVPVALGLHVLARSGGGPGRAVKTPWLHRQVLLPWAASRIAVLLVASAAVIFIGYDAAPGRFRVADDALLNLPARWDAGWYLNIARSGYRWDPVGLGRQQTVAFFPAFPFAMRLAADVLTLPARLFDAPELLGGGNARLVWGGTLVALLSSLGGCLHVHALARAHQPLVDPGRSVALLCAWPFAVFYSAPYTEGLFLFAASGAFLHATRQRHGAAAAYALLAGLTRPNGFLFSGALLVFVVERAWRTSARLRAREVAVAAAPLMGMLGYSAYVYRLAGDPFAWVKNQAAWGNAWTVTGFVTAKWHHLVDGGLWTFVTEPFGFLSAAAVVVSLSALPWVATRLSCGYAAYVALYLLPPMLINLPAIGRMTAVLFPTFLWLGSALPQRGTWLFIVLCSVGQALCAMVFFTWGALY